ncbi:MAG: penicillin-binding protein 1A [Candidatus Riflebacteria bacterium]|nr:penicillin-binding protein 1A [Candidatus Riflebacteria bacterium]
MLFDDGNEPEELEKLESDNSNEDEDDEEEESETITQRIIGWLWFFFKLGFVFSVIAIIIITGAIIGVVKGFSEKIPIISESSYRPNLTSQIYDCNGKVLAKLHAEENRTRILSSKEIPDNMKHAVVAIEDERFYQHYGIDIIGITRAMISNIKAGGVKQGASTLTQQLVKNAFLTSEKTFKRKAIEAMMAFQIERKYSKDEIITLYLNEIYFGRGAYGLAAASEIYFGKDDPKDLTVCECAMLASIPKSPTKYEPVKHPKENKERRALVLSKMVELGFITPAQYEEAKVEEPVLVDKKEEEMQAPYFTTYVRDRLLEKYGANVVYNGGLKVYTTIDMELQEYAEQAMASSAIFVNNPIDKEPELNGSLICLNPKNGHILAMYGGRDFNKSQFNRVTQAYRQPGSSFKPFVYAAALENGLLPSDTILDEFISYTNPWTKQVWAPRNSDHKFHGYVTLMKALAKSYNVPAVKLIDKLTPAKVIKMAKKMGVTAQMEPNLSLALGSGQFTPLEMASAYGVFANLGIYCRPIAITKVYDRDNNLLEENNPKAQEVMKSINAAMMCDLLKNALEKGTGYRAKVDGWSCGGKTGTTNDYIDAWFNGIAPNLVTIVQFGYDMPRTLGKGMAGGNVCAPVWHDFMAKALTKYPKSDFPVPDGGVRCRVCITSGKLASPSCPKNEIVTQVFPIESQPLVKCEHYKFVARNNAITQPRAETSDENADNNGFVSASEYFSANYQGASVRPQTYTQPTADSWIQRTNTSTMPSSNGVREPGVFIPQNNNSSARPNPGITFDSDYR